MKAKVYFLMLLCLPFVLTSCYDDNFNEYEAIIGDWYGTTNSMSCEFDNVYVYGGRKGGNIDAILLNYSSTTWQFDANTHIEYQLNPQNGVLKFHLYNMDPYTRKIYNEDYVSVKYYFEDYDHIVIDGAEFERRY